MNEYEVFIEDINSCGGEQNAKKELIQTVLVLFYVPYLM